MSSPTSKRAGQVWAHVGQPFTATEFDVVIIGAGRMGAALALYLGQLDAGLPEHSLSVLLVEEGGLPNEEGATILASGVWTTLDLPPAQHARAEWTRQQLETALGEVQFQPRPLVALYPDAEPEVQPTREVLAPFPEALALIDPDRLPFARLDAQAATYRPASVALNAAQQAIKLGVNLLLNTRATPSLGGVRLERLNVTNTHQIVTHEVVQVRAGQVIVAAGAAGASLAEHSLGRHIPHAEAYMQYPQLAFASQNRTPTLRVGPLTLRPVHGQWTLEAQPAHRDPPNYQPCGGKLTGVPTGLRRELLELLVAQMEAVPALASEKLELGRSLSDIAGAWVSLNPFPAWQALGDGVYLLQGGPNADTLGLRVAYELAGEVGKAACGV